VVLPYLAGLQPQLLPHMTEEYEEFHAEVKRTLKVLACILAMMFFALLLINLIPY
jgi:hypothetical protein